MFLKLNLKKKISITIATCKVLLMLLTVLSLFTIKFLGIIFAGILVVLSLGSIILLQKLGSMVEKLLTKHVSEVLNNNSTISTNVLSAISAQSSFVEKNKLIMDDIVNYVDKLKIEAYTTKDIAQSVIEKSQKTLMFSSKEENFIKEGIEKMYLIKQKIQIIAELILELSEQAQHISNNIGIVEDIAEQTNMLALNAAVEAARAGEHGKGFAVVASEIRKLADESKQATTKVIELVREIQNATNSTVMAAEEGSKEIESGVNITIKISENITELKMNIEQTVEDIYKILNALNSQFDNAECISQNTIAINKDMKDTSLEMQEKTEAIKEVLDIINTTKAEVS